MAVNYNIPNFVDATAKAIKGDKTSLYYLAVRSEVFNYKLKQNLTNLEVEATFEYIRRCLLRMMRLGLEKRLSRNEQLLYNYAIANLFEPGPAFYWENDTLYTLNLIGINPARGVKTEVGGMIKRLFQ